MDSKIRMIIIIASLFVIVFIGYKVKKKRLELRYALPWFGVSLAILFITIFPRIMLWLSEWMGIAEPVNMLFFLGFCFSLLLLFKLTTSLSRLSEKVKRLTQELAILEDKLENPCKENGKS